MPDLAAFGQVDFDEGAVLAAQFGERMQRLHHARALRPAAADSRRQRDDRDLPVRKRLSRPSCRMLVGQPVHAVQHVARLARRECRC